MRVNLLPVFAAELNSRYTNITRLMKTLLALLFLLLSSSASADEEISICFNYSCSKAGTARFSEQQLTVVAEKLKLSTSAVEEREVLGDMIGQLYYWAGQQTPINADRGGNTDDDGVEGEMDCIDHSTTTTRFLKMLENRRLLRYHVVSEVARRRRFLLFDHFSAVIEERSDLVMALQADGMIGVTKPHRYVIDSWFVNNGKPAVVLPLENWMNGAGSVKVERLLTTHKAANVSGNSPAIATDARAVP
jgi:hypothetical protein